MASLSMSSPSSVDRAPAHCLGVMGSIPVGDPDFSLCPMLVSSLLFHLITFITKLKTHHYLIHLSLIIFVVRVVFYSSPRWQRINLM